MCDRIREIFDTDCDVFCVHWHGGQLAGARANVSVIRGIICHQNAHIQTDECGGPEFFTGGSKLLLVGGGNGKIDIGQAKALLMRQNELHSHKPGLISIAQATEFGTVYTCDEIAELTELARAMNCLCTWRCAFRNAIRPSTARQERLHGRLELTFSASEGQRTARLLVS